MHPFYRPYVISDKPFTLLTECSPIKKTISISTGPISLANDKKSGNLNLNHYQCACIKPFISSILHLKSCSYNTVAFKVVIPGAKACLLGKGHLFPFTNLVVFLSEEPV